MIIEPMALKKLTVVDQKAFWKPFFLPTPQNWHHGAAALIWRQWDACITMLRKTHALQQRRKEKKEKLKTSIESTTKWQARRGVPLTIKSAAAETVSTSVCTIHTYFPECFSWMFLTIRSPANPWWQRHIGIKVLQRKEKQQKVAMSE